MEIVFTTYYLVCGRPICTTDKPYIRPITQADDVIVVMLGGVVGARRGAEVASSALRNPRQTTVSRRLCTIRAPRNRRQSRGRHHGPVVSPSPWVHTVTCWTVNSIYFDCISPFERALHNTDSPKMENSKAVIPLLVSMMLLTGVCNTLLTKYQVRCLRRYRRDLGFEKAVY